MLISREMGNGLSVAHFLYPSFTIGGGRVASDVFLNIDISRAEETIEALRELYTEEEFRRIVYSAFKQTGHFTRTAVKRIIPRYYNVTQTTVYNHIKEPKTEFGGGGIGVSCSIPIDGARMTIGGTFKAKGGAAGWNVKKGKRYKIRAQIVRGQKSVLPEEMEHQGGYPPFINKSAPKLHGVAFTRTGRKTKKGTDEIVRVVGLGVPQMPMNRAEKEVQRAVVDKLIERLEHEHDRRVKKSKR